MSDLTEVINDLGGAANDLFSSQGNAAQATDFQGAATLATQNAALAAASTRIQETQTARTISQTLGTQAADVAGAGFTESGSALDLLSSSAQQGALAKALINVQGAINENSYAAQAGAYSGEAAAANEASTAGTINAIAAIGGALVSGSGELASAGNTVATGASYIGSGLASDAGTALGDLGLQSTAESAGYGLNSVGAGNSAYDLLAASDAASVTDTAVASGASLGTAIDTSGIALGTTAQAATQGVADAAATIGADATADVAASAAADAGADVAASAAADAAAASAADAAGAVGADVASAAAGDSILDGIGDAVAVALSVICTSYYKRGMISRAVWIGARRYGEASDPATFAGYLLWATPIARRIMESPRFARRMFPFFAPIINEMAIVPNQKNINRTAYGYLAHRVLFGVSWVIGCLIKFVREEEGHDETRA